MPRYKVSLADNEKKELENLIQKGEKGYRIKHAQILLKLDSRPENENLTYDRIRYAYNVAHSTIVVIAKHFVEEGMESALGRKKQKNHYRKVIGDVKAHICAIACSEPHERRSHWTMQLIADKLIRL